MIVSVTTMNGQIWETKDHNEMKNILLQKDSYFEVRIYQNSLIYNSETGFEKGDQADINNLIALL